MNSLAAMKSVERTSRREETPEALRREMKALAERLSKDREAGRKFLEKAGIVTRAGNLKSRYK